MEGTSSSLAHGIRIGALGIALLAVAGWGAGGVGAMPDGTDARMASTKAKLPPFNFEIRTLSNRADLISDGNALVEVQVPKTVPMKKVTLTLNGADVRRPFVADEATRTLRGVVTGMAPGENTLVADSNGNGNGRPWASLTHHEPRRAAARCCSARRRSPGSAPRRRRCRSGQHAGVQRERADDLRGRRAVQHRDRVQAVLPHDDTPAARPRCPTRARRPRRRPTTASSPTRPAPTPADLATTTTTHGLTVPYIVRVERGTMNRGIYDIAVLFDPAKPWTALAPQAQWNGKVVYTFGASTGQPRLQFRTEQNWADDAALSRGFMVVDNSLTDSLYNSNRMLVAETLMMMKEHIVDTYGEIGYIDGQRLLGRLDPAEHRRLDLPRPARRHPAELRLPRLDHHRPRGHRLRAAGQLLRRAPEWTALMGGLTQAQINAKKTAINGHLDQRRLPVVEQRVRLQQQAGQLRADARHRPERPAPSRRSGAPRNNCLLPAALVYDPVTNPTGTRCGDADLVHRGLGHDRRHPAGQHARAQTGDNVGIQYGLKALQSGRDHAGGVRDAEREDRRLRRRLRTARPRAHVADPPALDIAYRAGIVSSGTNLGKLPIIDSRGYDEQGIHYIWRSFSERARIDAANGDHGNQVMWRYGTGLLPATAAQVAAVTVKSFLTMDTWLQQPGGDGAEGDAQRGAHARASRRGQARGRGRPLLPDGRPELHDPGHRHGAVRRRPAAAKHASPRQVAGGPLEENILEVPAEAAEPGRLCAGRLHRRAAGRA